MIPVKLPQKYHGELPTHEGVYAIVCEKNECEKLYIGSASNVKKRIQQHFNQLRRGEHANTHLQKAYNEHGKDAFYVAILTYESDEDDLIMQEYYQILHYGQIGTFNVKYPIAKNSPYYTLIERRVVVKIIKE